MKHYFLFIIVLFLLNDLFAKSNYCLSPQSAVNEFTFETDLLIKDLIEKGKTVQLTSFSNVFSYFLKPEYGNSYKSEVFWWQKENFKIVGFIDSYTSFGFIDVHREKAYDYIFVAFDDPFNMAPFAITILDDWNKIYKGLGRSLMILALQISKLSGAKVFKVKCVKNDSRTINFFKNLGFNEETKGNMYFDFSKTQIPKIKIQKIIIKKDIYNSCA